MTYSEILNEIVRSLEAKRHYRLIGVHLDNGREIWVDRSLGEEIERKQTYMVIKKLSREDLLPGQRVWKHYYVPYASISYLIAYDTLESDEKIFNLEIKKDDAKRRRKRRSSQK